MPSVWSRPIYTGNADDLQEFFTCQTEGLGITDDALITRLNELQVIDPSSFLDYDDDAVAELRRALADRSFDRRGRTEQRTWSMPPIFWIRVRGYSIVAKYHYRVRRNITPEAVKWTSTVHGFLLEYKALETEAAKDRAEMPRITSLESPIRMISVFTDWNKLTFGETLCHADYLYAEGDDIDTTNPADAPPLVSGRLYSAAAGSLSGEIYRRCDRTGADAKSDNAQLFADLCNYLRGTKYEKAGAAYQVHRDGVAFLTHLLVTYATDDAHESEAKRIFAWLEKARWNGPTNGQLVTVLEKMRAQFVRLKECSKHCHVQLPDSRKEVDYLLQTVTYKDPMICTYLCTIREGQDYRTDFEKSANYLAKCPYAGKDSSKQLKRTRFTPDISGLDFDDEVAVISGLDGEDDSGLSLSKRRYKASLKLKGGRGPRTKVDLRYHKPAEYKQLSQAQKDELNAWRESKLEEMGLGIPKRGNGGNRGGGSNKRRKGNRAIAALSSQISSLKSSISNFAKTAGKTVASAVSEKPEGQISAAQVAQVLRLFQDANANANANVSALTIDSPAGEATAATIAAEINSTSSAKNDDKKQSGTDGDSDVDAAIAAAASVGLQGILKKARKQGGNGP